jgi:hypothetical protein
MPWLRRATITTSPSKPNRRYKAGRVTKNETIAPNPQSDPIIVTVGQRSARLLVSRRMQIEARITKAVIAM